MPFSDQDDNGQLYFYSYADQMVRHRLHAPSAQGYCRHALAAVSIGTPHTPRPDAPCGLLAGR